MTTTQLLTRFRALYKETSSRFFDDDWALELMNDSVDDLETEIGPLNPEFFGTKKGYLGSPSTVGGYVVDQQEYVMSSDFRKVIQVLVKDRGGPPYPHLLQIDYWMKDYYFSPDYLAVDWLTAGGKGEPYWYYIMQKEGESTQTIGFVPIPTRTGSANGVEIVYHSQRTALTTINSESPDLPLDWHALIPWKMAMNAAAIDESVRYGYYQSQYQGRLARLLGEGMRGRGEAQERNETIDMDWLLPIVSAGAAAAILGAMRLLG